MSTQALYFHLAMRADDDGFVNGPRKILRMVGANDDDLRVLISKRYILAFQSGVIVIKHWRIHNYIQKDRYKPTLYREEMQLLAVKDNKSYTEVNRLSVGACEEEQESEAETQCIQDVYGMDTQVRLGKDRLGEVSQVEDRESTGADAPTPTPVPPKKAKPERHKYGEYGWVLLTLEQHARLLADLGPEELSRCIKYIDESAQSNGNKNKWRDWNLVIRRCSREGWGRNIRQSTPAKPDTLGILNRMMEESK
jgi:hypothetical protein